MRVNLQDCIHTTKQSTSYADVSSDKILCTYRDNADTYVELDTLQRVDEPYEGCI